MEKEFDYDLSESLEEMRARHRHDETCMDSLPKALVSFFEGESYEDVVRNAVSLGGDTDTIAAIAGSMGEAFFGIPLAIAAEGNSFIDEDMRTVLDAFDKIIGLVAEGGNEDIYENNKYIKMSVKQLRENPTEENFYTLLNVLLKRLSEDGMAPTPMVDVNNVMNSIDIDSVKLGDTLQFDCDVRLRIDTMQNEKGEIWIPLFTDLEEIDKKPAANVRMNMGIENLLSVGLNDEGVEGVVINPFGEAYVLGKPVLKILLEQYGKIKEQAILVE